MQVLVNSITIILIGKFTQKNQPRQLTQLYSGPENALSGHVYKMPKHPIGSINSVKNQSNLQP